MAEEKRYKLTSGEEINLATLRKRELEHINSLEGHIKSCTMHNNDDYFYVHSKAFEPISTGGNINQLQQLSNSPFYKVVMDRVTKYWHKCYGEKQEKD